MNSPIATNPSNNLSEQLRQLGLRAIPVGLDGFLARAAKSRWSPRQLLEFLVREESGDRARRSLERRLQVCGAKRFKPIADFDWTWPKKIERDVIERALTLVAKNLCHTAVLAGHSVLLRSASASWKICIARAPRDGAGGSAPTPMGTCCASTKPATSPR